MWQPKLFRRHSQVPLEDIENLQPWLNENPFLPVHLFQRQITKAKSFTPHLNRVQSVLEMNHYQLPINKREPLRKLQKPLPKVTIKLQSRLKRCKKMDLLYMQKEKIEKHKRSVVFRENFEMGKQLQIQRKIFLLLHHSQGQTLRKD